jgi:hypothetical protein
MYGTAPLHHEPVIIMGFIQYFSDILLEAKASENEEEYEQLNDVHELIQEIHRTVPDLLLNVIPQLEEETKVDELNVRTLGTKTLGIMFAEKNSFVAENYPLVWRSWLNRFWFFHSTFFIMRSILTSTKSTGETTKRLLSDYVLLKV